jgi:phosphoribosylformylglycinamidine synthase
MKAKVEVFLKPGVLDVQGKAVENALHLLGWPGASEVRVGRVITFSLAAETEDAGRRDVEAMSARLLANPVIESYRVEITP